MLSLINRDLAKSRIHRLSITKMFGIPVIVEICWNRLVVKLKNVRLECGNEKIVFNESYGLSLQIIDIDPSFSLGELQKERDDTLKKLHELGILNKNQSLPFPLLPKRIALISAESSKGLSDFMQMITESSNKYTLETHLFPA